MEDFFDFTIPGFPNVSDYIELPDIAELMMQPMWGRALAEDMRKHGTELQKYIIDKAPIKNDRKKVVVMSFFQLLYPGTRSVPNKFWQGSEDEWHRDGSMDLQSDRFDRCHLLLTDCQALTEFNVNEVTLSLPVGSRSPDLSQMINKDPSKYGIIGKKIEPNRFVSFDNHYHRTTNPIHFQFRYMFRIVESDYYGHDRYPECVNDRSIISKRDMPAGNANANVYHQRENKRVIIQY